MVGFIFGSKDKDKPWTYEELQRKRAMAETLAANMGTPKNVGEGLSAIGKALAIRGINKKASAEETRLRDEFNAKWGSVLGGLGGGGAYASTSGGAPSGTWTPAAPAPGPVEQMTQGMDVAKSGGLSFGNLPKADPGVIGGGKEPLDFGAAVMTPQEMLIEGAKRRGLDPIDVATAISYETGGKFDPTIKGPTTQWGTHEGLIQFGDPQGEKYGADFSNPDAAWRSQLNPDSGAVWRYLEDTGVKSGMGLPEIYSAINAGAVGRMGASDANNGGAPGTVADKVAGMAPHREKAAAFLGGTWTPNPDAGGNVTMSAKGPGGPQMGMDIGALIALGGDPMASPQQQAIVSALLQQEMQKMDPAYQMQLEKQQLELAQLKDPKAKPVELDTFTGADGVVYSFNPMTGETKPLTGADQPDPGYTVMTEEEAKALGLPPGAYQKGPKGEIKQIGGGGTTVNVGAGETQFDKTAGEAAAKTFTSIQDEGIAAATGISTLTAMESAMADPNFYSGTGAGAVEGLRRAAVSLGFANADEVTSMESFNALAKNAALSAMGGSLGAGFSNADRDFVEKQVPTLGNTPEGNREIIRIQKALLTRKQQMAELAATYAAEREAQGLRFDSAGFQKKAKEFAEANPLFGATPAKDGATGGIPAGVDPADWEFMTPEERALFQ